MQVLSDRLVASLERDGGKLLMRHSVEEIQCHDRGVTGVVVRNQKTGEIRTETADIVVANVTVQNLVKLLGKEGRRFALCSNFSDLKEVRVEDTSKFRLSALSQFLYRSRVKNLPSPSSAFVVYLGVKESAIPADCPPHLQFMYDYDGAIGENNSLFVSVSHAGDGRAPAGYATLIASSFVDGSRWYGEGVDYAAMKAEYTNTAIERLGQYFHLSPDRILVTEAGTPRTFERYTARDRGIVGGIGQRVSTFGPFGIATRTPVSGLWLVGDSTHPGEGTAGVSYSALTVVRQIDNN
jgi:C-3',4' desaturase CrtD